MSGILKIETIKDKIITLRSKPVLLDSDVAAHYGVETREINQAIKNNPEKFPTGYIFELDKEEKEEVIKNFDNPKIKFSPALPKAFTEQGLYMLATILKSEKAIQATIEIVETFTKIRELTRTVAELSNEPEEEEQKSLMQKTGEIFSDILGSTMETAENETTIELNFAVLKLNEKQITDKQTNRQAD